jgi:hypothetical protein
MQLQQKREVEAGRPSADARDPQRVSRAWQVPTIFSFRPGTDLCLAVGLNCKLLRPAVNCSFSHCTVESTCVVCYG